jgi:hypothetical protein
MVYLSKARRPENITSEQRLYDGRLCGRNLNGSNTQAHVLHNGWRAYRVRITSPMGRPNIMHARQYVAALAAYEAGARDVASIPYPHTLESLRMRVTDTSVSLPVPQYVWIVCVAGMRGKAGEGVVAECARLADAYSQCKASVRRRRAVARMIAAQENVSTSFYPRNQASPGRRSLLRRVLPPFVRGTPGQILALQTERESLIFKQGHAPTDNREWVAVELECTIDDELEPALLAALQKHKDLRRHVTVKTDGSIEAGEGRLGREIVVCGPRDRIAYLIANVCSIVTTYAAGRVNKSCGLHVHLDQRQVTKDVAIARFDRLVKAQELLFRLVAPSRLDNTYCKPSRSFDSQNRYHVINGKHAYQAHRTLEVRLHQGSLDAIKILAWIDLLIAIHDDTAAIPTTCRALRSTEKWLARYLPSNPALVQYWLGRRAALGYADAPAPSRKQNESAQAGLEAVVRAMNEQVTETVGV